MNGEGGGQKKPHLESISFHYDQTQAQGGEELRDIQ